MRIIRRLISVLLFFVGLHSASAFSLLGPFEPWMTTNLGFIININGGVDIGGPMNIGEGYRWNVPVITYGYDQSFLDYFGTNGVAAVEGAIQIFNDLPPASATNLNGYLLTTLRMNYRAEQQGLFDLKSSALGLILEQLGLASPTRFVYVLSNYVDPNNYAVIMRNFDPVTLESSFYVNGFGYAYTVVFFDQISFCNIFMLDPEYYATVFSAIADYTFNFYNPGTFYIGLTRDDVGGLSYLYGTNNFAVESLIPGVRGAGPDERHYVNRALRPGVGKITFQRLNYDETQRRFIPLTLRYVDSYLINNTLLHQMLEREIKQPDILFTAENLLLAEYSRTGTSNWVSNGGPTQYGPGIIQPPVAISFCRLGPDIYHSDAAYSGPADFETNTYLWGSFDSTTNAPFVYPTDSSKNNRTKIFFWSLGNPSSTTMQPITLLSTCTLAGRHGGIFLLQTTTNMSDWFTITSVTNLGEEVNYFDWTFPDTPQRFFRAVKQ